MCEFIESQVYASDSNERTSRSPVATFSDPLSILTRPRGIPAVIPTNHVHRVQNLFYAKGNLRLALGDTAGAQDEYEKAVEVALAVPSWVRSRPDTTLQYPTTGCTTRDLVVVMIVLGKILAAHAQAGVDPANKHLIAEMVRALGVSGPDGKVSFERLFTVVKEGGDPYVQMLIKHGGGVLPTVLLQPEALAQLPLMLFPETHGILPSLLETVATKDTDPAQASTIQSTNQTTSTMLLTLAKVFQDASGATSPSGSLTLGGIPSSQSLLLPLYYIALALYPSPSTCNNLGILLSTMNATTIVGPVAAGGAPVLLTGQVRIISRLAFAIPLADTSSLFSNSPCATTKRVSRSTLAILTSSSTRDHCSRTWVSCRKPLPCTRRQWRLTPPLCVGSELALSLCSTDSTFLYCRTSLLPTSPTPSRTLDRSKSRFRSTVVPSRSIPTFRKPSADSSMRSVECATGKVVVVLGYVPLLSGETCKC